jgi:pSer/pThr/pTyr-binding forkhead associated (FHA) protein
LRQELSVTDEEHYFVLGELGVEDPSLLNPQRQLSRENKLRLESYRRALELAILELVESGTPLQVAIERQQKQIVALRQEYAITADEQEEVLGEMFNQDGVLLRTAETLLARLQDLAVSSQILSNSVPNPQAPVYVLLRKAVFEKEKLVTTQLFRILEMLGDSPEAVNIARSTGILAVNVIGEILRSNDGQLGWQQRLGSRVFGSLRQQNQLTQRISLSTPAPSTVNSVGSKSYNLGVSSQLAGKRGSHLEAINDVLLELLQDLDPLVQAASLYALHQSNPLVGIQSAHQVLDAKGNKDWLVQETAQRILGQSQHHNQLAIPTLIAQVRAMGRTERRTFQQSTIRVGRGDENDIIILDKRVSRQHAIFYVDRKGVSVKDLGSSNGLRIGSDHIHDEQVQLKQGDIVRFSSSDQLVILVQWEMRSLQEDTITESVGTLEKLFWLYDSSFFQGLRANALIELARNASVRVYHPQQEICKMGTPATELIVLIDGEAMVLPNKIGKNATISPGQTIGELGVLTHSHYVATVVTGAVKTRTLAIKAAYFEAVLSQDPILAKNLLQIVTTRLQETLGQTAAVTEI